MLTAPGAATVWRRSESESRRSRDRDRDPAPDNVTLPAGDPAVAPGGPTGAGGPGRRTRSDPPPGHPLRLCDAKVISRALLEILVQETKIF